MGHSAGQLWGPGCLAAWLSRACSCHHLVLSSNGSTSAAPICKGGERRENLLWAAHQVCSVCGTMEAAHAVLVVVVVVVSQSQSQLYIQFPNMCKYKVVQKDKILA